MNAAGQIYAWGGNFNGQVGDGTQVDRLVPTLILAGAGLVIAGDAASFAFTAGGIALPPSFWTSFIGTREVL